MMTTSQSSRTLFIKFHVLPVDSMCIAIGIVLTEDFHIYCDYLAFNSNSWLFRETQ